MVHWVAAFIVLATMAVPAHAQRHLQPGIIGEDDRAPVEASGPPWSAIGQVNISGYRVTYACSGVLIAPKAVLTAAHCLIDPVTEEPFDPKRIHFAAGVRRDTVLGRSVADCVKLPEGFRYVGPDRLLPDLAHQRVPFEHFLRDLAVIVLADDIPAARPAMVVDDEIFRDGLPLVHASYPRDRRYMLTADASCTVLGRRQGVWLTDCDMQGASSGGPVLVSDGGDLKVAAVMVGSIPGTATLAVPVNRWPGLPVDAHCP